MCSKSQFKSSVVDEDISLILNIVLDVVEVNAGLEVVVVVDMIAVVEVVVIVLEVVGRFFGGLVGYILGANTGIVELESKINRYSMLFIFTMNDSSKMIDYLLYKDLDTDLNTWYWKDIENNQIPVCTFLH